MRAASREDRCISRLAGWWGHRRPLTEAARLSWSGKYTRKAFNRDVISNDQWLLSLRVVQQHDSCCAEQLHMKRPRLGRVSYVQSEVAFRDANHGL